MLQAMVFQVPRLKRQCRKLATAPLRMSADLRMGADGGFTLRVQFAALGLRCRRLFQPRGWLSRFLGVVSCRKLLHTTM